MGKNQQIPYLNEVLIYLIKVLTFYTIVHYLLQGLLAYNSTLTLTLAVFAGLSLMPLYITAILVNYVIISAIAYFVESQIIFILLNLIMIMLNTVIMILAVKIKGNFQEHK